ncbi:MAG: hypothetical protein ER33_12920 [Cyanobium sp. CACIAM 14]|nr:MAG: hypothetical protein ER33_12920 [Cyanobium sp. CACIAM 14]
MTWQGVALAMALTLLSRQPVLAATTVCVLTPRLSVNASGEVVAPVPLGAPTLLSSDSLDEVRIERDGEVLWQRLAQADQPIDGPIPWPLAPIRPRERLLLLLRPRGVSPDDYAVVILEGDPADRMGRAQAERNGLGSDPIAWWRSIQGAFDRGDISLGLALLFAFDGPSSPRLDNLRRAVFLAGCGGGGGDAHGAPARIGATLL